MSENLKAFATAVGTDIKDIRTELAKKADKGEVGAGGVTEEQLTTAINQAKADIIGGAPEELDTLKEIADKISQSSGDTNAGIVSKMTELGQRIDTIEQVDMLAAYNTAKG